MSAPLPQRHVEDDDSENDPDFIPATVESDSSDSESRSRAAKKQKVCAVGAEEDVVNKQVERSKLWEDFQASVSTPPPKTQSVSTKTVKIVKTYRFAGEDVKKIVEVLEDSEDAKRWPLYELAPGGPSSHPLGSQPSPSPVASSSGTPQPELKPPHPRPGPRRPKKSLDAMFATATAKKLTTLDKSAMDWKEHVASSKDIKDDLEANRRGGGYLDKVEFLQRVERRKEAEREQVGSKRRR